MCDQSWESFTQYVTKLETMIMKIHNKQEIQESEYFTKLEYSECNTLVFEMVFESIDDLEMSQQLQEEFGRFIKHNVR